MKKNLPLFILGVFICSLIPGSSNAQQLFIKNFAVWGGDANCPNGLNQVTPPTPPGCAVFIGQGSVVNGNVGSYHFVRLNGGDVFGNINSGGNINFSNSSTTGNITAANGDGLSGDILHTGSGTTINGDVNVTGDVNIGASSTVTGVKNVSGSYSGPGAASGNPPVLPTMPLMPVINNYSCANPQAIPAKVANVISFTPGTYTDLIADNSALSVVLDGPGIYIFNSINLSAGGGHSFIFDFNNQVGNIYIYVCGDVSTGDMNCSIINAPYQDACNVFWETHGQGPDEFSFRIEAGSDFYGTVWAPYAGIKLNNAAVVTGHLWSATQVDIEHGSTVNTCEICSGSITITKEFTGTPPANDWAFTSDIPGHFNFTLPKAGGSVTFNDVDPGSYTVTETNQNIPGSSPVRQYTVTNTCGLNNVANITLGECENKSCTFNNSCKATIKITKNVITDCPNDNDDKTQWAFKSNITGFEDFVINASFGNPGSQTFNGLAPGTYTITETLDPNWSPSTSCTGCDSKTSNSITFKVVACEDLTGTFDNTNPGCQTNNCQWCNKGAVLSQVWQNPGCDNPNNKCVVPDILVDVDMAHGGANDVVDATEVRTSKPATWSIQAAVDFITNPANLALFPSPCGELFIGVVGQDPVPVNPADENSCGHSCAYPLSGDTPFGLENVVVNNTTTRRLNIFGCSVTMRPLDPTKPVFKVLRNSIPGAGKVTILDLHVYTTTKVAGVAGYLVQGSSATNGGRFTLKNARARGFDIGYDIQVDNVEITGSAEISGGSYGVKITGNNNILRTNNQIWDNSLAGVKISGNSNELSGNDIGGPGHPNGVGIQVSGNASNIHDNPIYSNTGDGLNISGNTSNVKGNKIGDDGKGNGGDGIEVSGTGNVIDGNDVLSNNANGIYLNGGSNNVVKGNLAGDKNKGNKKNGIYVNDTGNGTSTPIEIESNTTRANGTVGVATDGVGIKVTGTGHQLKNNQSGGGSSENNVHCEFSVVAGNFNATGNKANGVTIAGANGTAFPVACQGSARGVQTLDDLRMITGFKVFPNPGKGRMTVEFVSATTSDYTINVLDIAGRKVMTISYLAQQGANTFDLDISKVSGGVYMMSVQNGIEKFLKKIVVQ